MRDRLVIRSYTPTRPLLSLSDSENDGAEDGTFDIVVKTYFPTEDQPGGAISNLLDCMEEGEEVEVRGPTGDIKYLGHGKFSINDEDHVFDKVTLILGGSGITPGYQLMGRIMELGDDKTLVQVIDANKDEGAILLREDLDKFSRERDGKQVQVTHVLSHPSEGWEGEKGHVNEEIIKKYGYGPEGGRSVALLCGPPAMIQKAALPALSDWGYEEGKNMFGF
jgi:nitrate reductase (NAD(P)H)